jgi:hypothetical protein
MLTERPDKAQFANYSGDRKVILLGTVAATKLAGIYGSKPRYY